MSKSIEEVIGDDLGIDITNYSLEQEIQKYDGVTPVGWQILIRVYVPPKIVKIGNIYLSDDSLDKINQDNKFANLTGLVIKLSNGAYKDMTRYELTGPYCQVGDWVQFPRAHGYSFSHNKLTSIYMNEDSIIGVIKDPSTITRIT